MILHLADCVDSALTTLTMHPHPPLERHPVLNVIAYPDTLQE